jgi:hypothetical protein
MAEGRSMKELEYNKKNYEVFVGTIECNMVASAIWQQEGRRKKRRKITQLWVKN